jgi:DNA-binding CsgD family transcriptional regulator
MLSCCAQTQSELIAALYDAALDTELWVEFLQKTARAIDARSAALVMHDTEGNTHAVQRSWGLDPEADRLYQRYYGLLDVWAQRGISKPCGYVCTSASLWPVAEMATTEIYNDFMVPFGIEHGLFEIAENSGSTWASISFYRDSRGTAFEACHLEMVRALAPHMQRAFRVHGIFSQLKARSEGFENALEILATGVIFFGAAGEVLFMNRSASNTIAEKDGLLSARDGLRAEKADESSSLEKTIREAASKLNGERVSSGGAVKISRNSRPPLCIQISPIRAVSIKTSRPIKAMGILHDPLRQPRPSQELLRAAYKMTPAECRVAMLLADGRGPREIAETVGVTFETIRSQIKSIFAKTNVRRQSQLVRFILDVNAHLVTQGRNPKADT